ncbi:MAG: zinc ABC transporter substrate-binding protein, partial [Betaproteobacteria bacterium]
MPARILGLLITAAAMAAPVSGALSVAPASAALRVVATTTDLATLAAAVGGELVSVESIVPPATDPEAFEPRPGDADKLRRAALLVRVGLGYDYWLDALTQPIGDKRLMRGGDAYLDASAGIPLLEIRGQSVMNEGGHSHGVANPHYWLDP